MNKPFQCQKTVPFQTIQLSLSTHFSSILPIDRTLSGAPLRAEIDLGAMAIKGYSTFLKDSALLKPSVYKFFELDKNT